MGWHGGRGGEVYGWREGGGVHVDVGVEIVVGEIVVVVVCVDIVVEMPPHDISIIVLLGLL